MGSRKGSWVEGGGGWTDRQRDRGTDADRKSKTDCETETETCKETVTRCMDKTDK